MQLTDAGNPYASFGLTAAQADVDTRASFIAKTYGHLLGSLGVFALIEAALINTPGIDRFVIGMSTGYMPLIMLGAFLLVSFVANNWALNATSLPVQYAGLALYIAVTSVVCLPLLFLASLYVPSAIPTAAIITGCVFGGLTAVVFMTRKDFSFLGPVLAIASMAVLGVAICCMVFGFQTGYLGIGVGIALAAGWILYDTSNVLHHYRIGQHVAAALALFASVVYLFMKILQLVIALSGRD
jgi:FtsH-binding integral membrane protein